MLTQTEPNSELQSQYIRQIKYSHIKMIWFSAWELFTKIFSMFTIPLGFMNIYNAHWRIVISRCCHIIASKIESQERAMYLWQSECTLDSYILLTEVLLLLLLGLKIIWRGKSSPEVVSLGNNGLYCWIQWKRIQQVQGRYLLVLVTYPLLRYQKQKRRNLSWLLRFNRYMI